MTERDRVLALLRGFFKGDEKKVRLWMEAPNTLLGGLIPREYLIMRPGRLLRFVQDLLSENVRRYRWRCSACDADTIWLETPECRPHCSECHRDRDGVSVSDDERSWLRLIDKESVL